MDDQFDAKIEQWVNMMKVIGHSQALHRHYLRHTIHRCEIEKDYSEALSKLPEEIRKLAERMSSDFADSLDSI